MRALRICGRPLIDFLNGDPYITDDKQVVRVKTGNDLTMLSAKCILVDGYSICWNHEPVARPFDFIDNRCEIIEGDGASRGEFRLHCLGLKTI